MTLSTKKATQIRRHARTLVAFAAAAALLLTACSGQEAAEPTDDTSDFPAHKISVIVGNEPGGSLDLQFRSIQKYWEAELGQSLVPEYISGGKGNIARTRVMDAPADGYTIGVVGAEQLIFAIVTGTANYGMEDFGWVGRQVYQPVTIMVRADSPYKTFEDVLDAAAKDPGKIKVGLGNIASDKGLTLLLIQEVAGVEFSLIPFDGGNASRLALLAGDVDLVATNVFTGAEMGDEVRTLVVHAPSNEFKDITDDAPTLAEALGEDVGLAQNGGSGVYYVPAGLATEHPEHLRILTEALERAMQNPEYLESLGDRAREASYLDPDAMNDLAQEQYAIITKNQALFEGYVG